MTELHITVIETLTISPPFSTNMMGLSFSTTRQAASLPRIGAAFFTDKKYLLLYILNKGLTASSILLNP